MLVTRGVGGPHLRSTGDAHPVGHHHRQAQVDPPPEAYERGVRVVIVDVVRNHPETVNR